MTKQYLRGIVDSRANGSIGFTAATAGVKRDGLDLNIGGLRTQNFEANPVFLWAHDYAGRTLPIGKVSDLDKQGDQLRGQVEFDTSDEFAMRVEQKYRDGFLNTVSVGWATLNRSGNEVTDSDLLDISAVPVPGDPSALVDAQRSILAGWAEEFTRTDSPVDDILDAVVAGSRFEQAALSMWGLFHAPDVGTVEQRQAVYAHLREVYRREGKTAPEYVADMPPQLARLLFLEGELEIVARQSPVAALDAAIEAAQAAKAALLGDEQDDDEPVEEVELSDDQVDALADLASLSDVLDGLTFDMPDEPAAE